MTIEEQIKKEIIFYISTKYIKHNLYSIMLNILFWSLKNEIYNNISLEINNLFKK